MSIRTAHRFLAALAAVSISALLLVDPAVAGATDRATTRADIMGPTTPGQLVALTPSRLLDTRNGVGGATPSAKGSVDVPVLAHAGVPFQDVSAVVLNVTAYKPAAAGFLTVYASGAARPNTSDLNFAAGRTVTNRVLAQVGSDGSVILYNGSLGRTPLLVDVVGYVVAGPAEDNGALTAVTPARLLDTRTRTGGSAPSAHGTVSFPVGGRAGVPSGVVGDVLMNITAVSPTANGYLTAYDADARRPGTSSVTFAARTTVATLVLAPADREGRVTLYNGSGHTVDVVADVVGYTLAGDGFQNGTLDTPSSARLLDTRTGQGATTPSSGGTVHLQVLGRGGVPTANVDSVLLTVTVTNPAAAGYLTVHDDTVPQPVTSDLNFAAGQTVSNLVLVPVGYDGKVALYNGSGGRVSVIADVVAYVVGNETGTISGRITDATTGKPLGGVVVEVLETDKFNDFPVGSNPDGTFVVRSLQEGDYRVCTVNTTPPDPVVGKYRPTCYFTPSGQQTVHLGFAAHLTGIDIALTIGS